MAAFSWDCSIFNKFIVENYTLRLLVGKLESLRAS